MLLDNLSFPVCIKCYTYNHVNYIANALDGFCMQKTNFPFVCLIVDDASTDGELEVIQSYFQNHFDLDDQSIVRNEENEDYILSFARHQENTNCYFAVFFLKYNHYKKKAKVQYLTEWRNTAKYEASCEGDDYWIDPLKLQKQYDALESHPDCTISFCKVRNVSRKGTDLRSTKPGNYMKPGIVTLENLLKYQYGKGRWVFQTSGYFYRLRYFEECIKTDFYRKHPVGDEPLMIEYLLRGKGYYIDDICSCYRVQSGGYTSAWRFNPQTVISFQKTLIDAIALLDKHTNYMYHKYIEVRKLTAFFNIDYCQENYTNLFRYKYWCLYYILPKKTVMVILLRIICPPLYRRLRKHRLSH